MKIQINVIFCWFFKVLQHIWWCALHWKNIKKLTKSKWEKSVMHSWTRFFWHILQNTFFKPFLERILFRKSCQNMSSKVLLHIFWKPECITIGKWKNSYVKIYIQTISQLGSQYWKTEIGLYTEPSLTRVYQNLFSSLVSSLFFREIIFARKKFWKLISRKKNLFLWIGAIFDHALKPFYKNHHHQ